MAISLLTLGLTIIHQQQLATFESLHQALRETPIRLDDPQLSEKVRKSLSPEEQEKMFPHIKTFFDTLNKEGLQLKHGEVEVLSLNKEILSPDYQIAWKLNFVLSDGEFSEKHSADFNISYQMNGLGESGIITNSDFQPWFLINEKIDGFIKRKRLKNSRRHLSHQHEHPHPHDTSAN